MTVDAGDVATIGLEAVSRGTNTVGVFDTLDRENGKVIGRFLETGIAGETVMVLVG